MLKSMTGFGVGHANLNGQELALEVRSLNHKFCEVKVRLPRELASLESAVAKQTKERVVRGSVDVVIRRQVSDSVPRAVVTNLPLAKEYLAALRSISAALRLDDAISLREVAMQPGVLSVDEPPLPVELAAAALTHGLDEALGKLIQMREVEGEAIRVDLEGRLDRLDMLANELATLSPTVLREYHLRLSERVEELARGVPVDPQRLAQEVAFFAERTDVAEEVTRLRSHLKQFRDLLRSAEPSGRKMDFLVQEMHREVNTLGSKGQSIEISTRIVTMKAEIERLREQVQNVE